MGARSKRRWRVNVTLTSTFVLGTVEARSRKEALQKADALIERSAEEGEIDDFDSFTIEKIEEV